MKFITPSSIHTKPTDLLSAMNMALKQIYYMCVYRNFKLFSLQVKVPYTAESI